MDVKYFLDTYKSYNEVASTIAKIASDTSKDSIELLADFLRFKDPDTEGKHYTPKIASIALLNKGKDGVDKLITLLSEIDGHIYSKSILDCLWFASKNLLVHFIDLYHLKIIEPLQCFLDNDTVLSAKNAFYDAVISSSENDELSLVFSESIPFYKHYLEKKGIHIDFSGDIMSILSDSTLKISQVLIRKFAMLIDLELSEEDYQVFFKKNPILIEPTSFRIFDKHKLGDDLITDFVVETLENHYYVVEIEKPHDKIFNKNGDFSQRFTHAFGQVLDFIDWVENNIAYAQKKLPDIVSPKGILIMGRSVSMTERDIRKLRRFNKNSNSVEVLTYDDVILKANNLYKNLRSGSK